MIARHQEGYPVTRLCRLAAVSSSGYYAWVNRQPSRRAKENGELIAAMRQIHEEVSQRYGSPRMHAELLQRGYRCGEHRVARLMRRHELVARQRQSAAKRLIFWLVNLMCPGPIRCGRLILLI
jgi:hypothetical protein